MDWQSWLCRTSIDPAIAYEYALVFGRNELRAEDLSYFDHEFLQSIGVSVAKHRLEILKLARKEARGRGVSRLVLAINKTRRLLKKGIGKWGFKRRSLQASHRSGAVKKENVMWSGPLDRRMVMGAASHSVSGPLDGGKMHPSWSPMVMTERVGLFCKSPTISGPIDRWGLSPKVSYCSGEMVGDDEVHSLWSLMFQDMKPT